MKVAISIPEDVYKKAERLARRLRMSRSQLYSNAVREYLEKRHPESVTDAMNHTLEKVDAAQDEFVSAAAQRVLKHTEW